MSQLQYRNGNQDLISNFVFQFIKKKQKRNGTLGTRIVMLLNFNIWVVLQDKKNIVLRILVQSRI